MTTSWSSSSPFAPADRNSPGSAGGSSSPGTRRRRTARSPDLTRTTGERDLVDVGLPMLASCLTQYTPTAANSRHSPGPDVASTRTSARVGCCWRRSTALSDGCEASDVEGGQGYWRGAGRAKRNRRARRRRAPARPRDVVRVAVTGSASLGHRTPQTSCRTLKVKRARRWPGEDQGCTGDTAGPTHCRSHHRQPRGWTSERASGGAVGRTLGSGTAGRPPDVTPAARPGPIRGSRPRRSPVTAWTAPAWWGVPRHVQPESVAAQRVWWNVADGSGGIEDRHQTRYSRPCRTLLPM
jgi:hypothetical protein